MVTSWLKWSNFGQKIDAPLFYTAVEENLRGMNERMKEQAGAELGQAQVKLEVIVEVGVEDRCIYLIPSEF